MEIKRKRSILKAVSQDTIQKYLQRASLQKKPLASSHTLPSSFYFSSSKKELKDVYLYNCWEYKDSEIQYYCSNRQATAKKVEYIMAKK